MGVGGCGAGVGATCWREGMVVRVGVVLFVVGRVGVGVFLGAGVGVRVGLRWANVWEYAGVFVYNSGFEWVKVCLCQGARL